MCSCLQRNIHPTAVLRGEGSFTGSEERQAHPGSAWPEACRSVTVEEIQEEQGGPPPFWTESVPMTVTLSEVLAEKLQLDPFG